MVQGRRDQWAGPSTLACPIVSRNLSQVTPSTEPDVMRQCLARQSVDDIALLRTKHRAGRGVKFGLRPAPPDITTEAPRLSRKTVCRIALRSWVSRHCRIERAEPSRVAEAPDVVTLSDDN